VLEPAFPQGEKAITPEAEGIAVLPAEAGVMNIHNPVNK
jgi:hypothetical protein